MSSNERGWKLDPPTCTWRQYKKERGRHMKVGFSTEIFVDLDQVSEVRFDLMLTVVASRGWPSFQIQAELMSTTASTSIISTSHFQLLWYWTRGRRIFTQSVEPVEARRSRSRRGKTSPSGCGSHSLVDRKVGRLDSWLNRVKLMGSVCGLLRPAFDTARGL